MIAALRHGAFARLWLAGLISRAGDWVLAVGLPIYVFLLTHSVVALSFAVLSATVPGILLGTVAGVFVDRWDRKRTLVVANVLLALGLLPLLLVRTPDLVWIIYVVSVVEACLEQFTMPAQNALLPALVGEEHLVPANALNGLSSNLARLLGPAIGGLVAATFGLNGIVLADAASFLLAALLVAGIAVRAKAAPEISPAAEVKAAVGLWRDWVDGLRVIAADRTLMVLLAMFAITSLGEGVFGVLYPVFVYRVLHGGAFEIGQLMSAQAVGGLLGGVLVGWLGQRTISRWAISLSTVSFGLIDLAIFNLPVLLSTAFALLGVPLPFPVLWFAIGLFVAVGIPGIAFMTGMQSLLQATSPGAYLGRVFGALGMTMGLFQLIGVVTAGAVTDRLGVVTVLNIQGMGYVLAGLLGITLLRRSASAAGGAPAARDHEPVPSEV
jgi:MFS family permease